ncbi:Ras-related GTP-binding protein C, partial [Eschrichtius robustus]|nr:Ras-related GTP-binding protein C [Eschrichtius robustus]
MASGARKKAGERASQYEGDFTVTFVGFGGCSSTYFSTCGPVVFHKMSPNETLFLESTNKIYKDDISNSSFVNFQIWDFPGQMDFFDPTFDYEMIFRGTGALIYVIDAQDDYMEALTRLHITVSKAYKVNPDMNFEVFIHKVDGLSDDHKIETQRDIHQRANDDLADAGLEKLHLRASHLTGIEKAFLFDVVSKIYIATDSSPVDMQSYELCCDMIDVVIDVSCIYGTGFYSQVLLVIWNGSWSSSNLIHILDIKEEWGGIGKSSLKGDFTEVSHT